jgi:hypothetical protein
MWTRLSIHRFFGSEILQSSHLDEFLDKNAMSYGLTQRPPSEDFASAWQVPAAAVEHLAGQVGLLQSASNHPFATLDRCSIANGSEGWMKTRHSQPGAAAARFAHCEPAPGLHSSCLASSAAYSVLTMSQTAAELVPPLPALVVPALPPAGEPACAPPADVPAIPALL